jgi:hypothetical protein
MALLVLGKLINQLDEMVFVLAALAAVSVTATGVKPVASAISAVNISELTGIIEYWLAVSLPTFLGTLVTRYEVQRELRSIRQVSKKVEIASFCISRAERASGEAGRRANPVLMVWTPLSTLLFSPSLVRRLS